MAAPDRSTTPRRHPKRWALRSAVLGLALLAAVAAEQVGLAGSIDRLIEPLRFALLSRPASGGIVVVEMDAASAAAIRRWPWPRSHYATVVDRLREAGVAGIVFDVDLSAASTPHDDGALAASLARADGLAALPTFGQAARTDDHRSLDAMPIPLLRPHVALASVSVSPDEDGLVRDAPLGTMTYGQPHPSLSAYLAHRGGSADTPFPIDFGIDPASVPRLSFARVEAGRFDPAAVRGKQVLIGATAIEMGDRYAVPRWGILPGVVVQALAAETLLRGVPGRGGNALPMLAAALLALAVLATRGRRGLVIAGPIAVLLLGAGLIAAQAAGLMLPVGAALVLLVGAISGKATLLVLARLREQRMVDEDTGLPTRRALLAQDDGERRPLLVAQIANFDSLVAVLPAGTAPQLVLRLAERLQFAAAGPVHRVADRLLAVEPAVDDIPALVERLRPILLAPIEVAGRRVDAVVALGTDAAEATIAGRLAIAGLAAEEAARSGRFWQAGGADMHAAEQHASLLGDLDRAVATGEISVAYQPKLAIASGRIASAEALVRWRTAAGENVPPSLFIPVAEQAGRIAPLTLHVLERVLADLANWLADGLDLTVAVNISAALLGEASFDAAVGRLLAHSPVPPARLVFEVTESATLADADAAVAALERFAALGIAVSMDDYGTGQSTLSYLKRLPLSELKIDRAFVEHVATDAKDAAMVRSTIELAHQLGVKVVAEGIEDAACLDTLARLGCDLAQGYHISRPINAAAFTRFIDDRRRLAA